MVVAERHVDLQQVLGRLYIPDNSSWKLPFVNRIEKEHSTDGSLSSLTNVAFQTNITFSLLTRCGEEDVLKVDLNFFHLLLLHHPFWDTRHGVM